MLGRIIEIVGEGRGLTLHRGFLNISGPEGLLGQVPFDDIEAVIASSPALSYTNQALAALGGSRGATLLARIIWQGLHTWQKRPDANSYLNYCYTVLRAAAARSIVAAGLHPSLSLRHKSKGDALRLADDLIEPFRPAVDLSALDPASKKRLAAVLHADYETDFESIKSFYGQGQRSRPDRPQQLQLF